MLVKIKAISAIVALLLLAVLAGESAYTVHVTRPKLLETQAALNDMALNLRDYAKDQTEDLRSPRNQKMVEHYLQIGEAGLLTIQKLNRTTIPRLNSAFDELVIVEHGVQRVTTSADQGMLALADLIRHSDASMNQELVPRIAKLADSLNITILDLNADVKRALEAGLTTADTLNKALTNPRIDALLEHTTGAMTNLEATTAHVEEGFREFPTLVKLYEKYAKAATRWQKAIYLAQIINLLGGLPRP